MTAKELAAKLLEDGAVVVPFLEGTELTAQHNNYLSALRAMPEFRRNSKNPDINGDGKDIAYVKGGFRALANPSSFHNDAVRHLRKLAHKRTVPIFAELLRIDSLLSEEFKLEQLFD
jgi:hypothetical protein